MITGSSEWRRVVSASAADSPRRGIQDRINGAWRAFSDWWMPRARALDVFDEYFAEDAKRNPWNCVGALSYFFFLIILVTGFWLIIYYVPTTYHAYNSVFDIQHKVWLGGWMRGLHKYGADAFMICIIIRIYRMYFTAEHRKPHELTFALAILLLMFGMFSGLTGYLLIWNQRAYWATKVFATFPTYMNDPYLPGINQGTLIAQIMLGGMGIGPATITRFYAGHYALSTLLAVLAEVHFYRRGLKRLNLSRFQMGFAFLMLLVITAIFPAVMGAPADPSMTPENMFSDWYFLGLYALYRIQDPYWATIFTMPALPLVAMIASWWDRRGGRRPLDRPFTFTLGVLLLVYWIWFSICLIIGLANKRLDPIMYVGIATAVLGIGALWEVQHFKKRPGTVRPFPTMMDACAGIAALVAVCYLIYPIQASIRLPQDWLDDGSAMFTTMAYQPAEFMETMKQANLAGFTDGIAKLKDWVIPFSTIQGITIDPSVTAPFTDKYPGWWTAVIQNDTLNMSVKFYQWVLLAVILGGTSFIDIKITRKLNETADPIKEVIPEHTGNPDWRYAIFWAVFFVCLLFVAAFGIVSEGG